MQKGHRLELDCSNCQTPIPFSLFELEKMSSPLSCPSCEAMYRFDDPTLRRQLQKFEALCKQIVDSEEILSDTSVGVNVGERCVKVPYKILLSRLNSSLELQMGDRRVTIAFRMEPTQDLS